MKLRFKKFTAIMKSWEDVFGEAADFASRLPTDRLLTISHSCDNSEGVVAVWFWATDDEFKEWTKG
jgi:hypothetical protein